MGWSMWMTRAQFPFRIGRHPTNDLCNVSSYISRNHCVLDYKDDQLLLVDSGSMNGSIVQNRHIRSESFVIEQRTCVLLSDMMFWIAPCDAEGKVVRGEAADESVITALGDSADQKQENHGICLVDIVNSTEMAARKISLITRALRAVILVKDQNVLLLLKNMGDGYLIVYHQVAPALRCAERLLHWQTSGQNPLSCDIRLAVDAGITYSSHSHDRIGLAICRAVRFEKTQRADIELPGQGLKSLKPRNRCLVSELVRDSMDEEGRELCTHVGARKLKGFSSILHHLYQYSAD